MEDRRARQLVAKERSRIEAALAALTGDVQADIDLGRQQTGESDDGSELATEMVEQALVSDLRLELLAVERAEARIASGTYGRSIVSGLPMPDERLEVAPLSERTVQEERAYEQQMR